MKKYRLQGGGTISGSSVREIVWRLRDKSFNPENTDQEYMEQTAEGCKLYDGSIIRTNTKENFVEDLIKNKFLVEEMA